MSFMSSPSTPKPVPPPPAPPPPTVDNAAVQAQSDADALRSRRGMASTILAGGSSAGAATPQTGAARLLGS